MAYIDVPTSTDLVRDGMKVLTLVDATCDKGIAGTIVFSIESDGTYRMALTALGTEFANDDQIVIRNSVDTTGKINNDGVYTIVDAGNANYLTVLEPVIAATSDGAATADEIDTFILHPDKRCEQICVFVINSAATSPQISFVPGPFWAASTKKNIPPIQGTPDGATSNLFQVETAKYLQTESEELTGEINREGSILMRLMPATGESGATVKVAFIQLF